VKTNQHYCNLYKSKLKCLKIKMKFTQFGKQSSGAKVRLLDEAKNKIISEAGK